MESHLSIVKRLTVALAAAVVTTALVAAPAVSALPEAGNGDPERPKRASSCKQRDSRPKCRRERRETVDPPQPSPSPRPTASPVLRSGWVLGGIYSTGPWTCGAAPDCVGWLQSACDPARRGPQDPALFTSIVEVGDLAGTDRMFRGRMSPQPPYGGGLVLEFWDAGCRKIWPPYSPGWLKGSVVRDVAITIPPGTRWMTAVASDVANVSWKLW